MPVRRHFLTALFLGVMAMQPLVADAKAQADPSLTEKNRAIMQDFVHVFYRLRDVRRAFEAHVAPAYIQHNPEIGDGRDVAIEVLTPLYAQDGTSSDVKRLIVDGDLAVVHVLEKSSPTDRGTAVVDIFRLHDGKIVEHWDVMQPMPATAANPHPMF